ncbi:CDP-glycerol glycerophosphotransferase family protein, partial [Bacillus cereus]
GFVYDFSHYSDINELYVISDMLITDYSSVFFD